MIRGLYSAASALEAATEQQEVLAHNLAHASTPGYRQRGLTFETFDRALGRAQAATGDLTGAKVTGTYHDFRPGPVQQTGHPFDLAVGDPDAFFAVDGPDGPLFTRNGAFRLSPQGQVVTQAGYPLRGDDGPIRVPPNAADVAVGADGTVTADGVPAGRVRLARFADPTRLTAAGPAVFAAGPGAGEDPAGGRVLRGYREGSNVNPADAMVRMIVGARHYDAAQRAMRTMAESVQLNTRPQAA